MFNFLFIYLCHWWVFFKNVTWNMVDFDVDWWEFLWHCCLTDGHLTCVNVQLWHDLLYTYIYIYIYIKCHIHVKKKYNSCVMNIAFIIQWLYAQSWFWHQNILTTCSEYPSSILQYYQILLVFLSHQSNDRSRCNNFI